VTMLLHMLQTQCCYLAIAARFSTTLNTVPSSDQFLNRPLANSVPDTCGNPNAGSGLGFICVCAAVPLTQMYVNFLGIESW